MLRVIDMLLCAAMQCAIIVATVVGVVWASRQGDHEED